MEKALAQLIKQMEAAGYRHLRTTPAQGEAVDVVFEELPGVARHEAAPIALAKKALQENKLQAASIAIFDAVPRRAVIARSVSSANQEPRTKNQEH